jgi:hypothetical protein
VTKEEHDELCAPLLECIAVIRQRHEQELKPWYEKLSGISATYTPRIEIPLAVWERLQLEQGIGECLARIQELQRKLLAPHLNVSKLAPTEASDGAEHE